MRIQNRNSFLSLIRKHRGILPLLAQTLKSKNPEIWDSLIL